MIYDPIHPTFNEMGIFARFEHELDEVNTFGVEVHVVFKKKLINYYEIELVMCAEGLINDVVTTIEIYSSDDNKTVTELIRRAVITIGEHIDAYNKRPHSPYVSGDTTLEKI